MLHTFLQLLGPLADGRLIEPAPFYVPHPRADGLIEYRSERVQGDITATISRGEGNALIRGLESMSTRSNLTISGSRNVLFLGPYSRLNNADIRITGNDGVFFFGAFATVESMVVMLTGEGGRISIGDHCMLSARIIIDRSDHHGIYDTATGARINHDRDVEIHDHTWLGRDVRVGKGAVIERDSIVGQGSVVSGRLKAGCIHAGAPAKPIREGVTWSRMKAESLGAMEASTRHQDFLRRVDALGERIRSGHPGSAVPA